MATLKKHKTGFVQVSNSLLNDEELSFKAKGIYSFLASKPDGWNFEAQRIANQSKDGRRSVLSGIKELEDIGYLNRKRLGNGRIEYELLANINLSAKTAQCRNRTVLKPHCAETALISNKENIVIKSNSNKDFAEQGSAQVLSNLLEDKKKHIQIIGLFAKAKKIQFENVEQQSAFIKRNLRTANDLTGYGFQRIAETMNYLIKNADFKWTLETVLKYIDEDINNLNTKKTIINI
jgi:hypothetical protein